MLTQVPAAAWIHPGMEVEPLTLRHIRKYKMFRGAIYRIMVSRGCPMHCAYCANSFLKGIYPDMKLRWRSTENIMRELELAVAEDPAIRAVTFADDVLLSMPVDDLRDFCAQYKARVGLPFMAKTTPAHITRERMDLLVGAGMGWVNVGLQDANDRICKEVYKRPIGWEVFRRAADLIHEYPVAPYYDLILNNPFATFEEDVKTAEMLLDLPRPYFLQPFSLTFYRGTEIRERALRERPECVVEPEFKDCYRVEFVPKEAVKVICTTIHRPVGRALIRRLRRVPDGWLTQFLMDLAGFYHRMVLQPFTMLRLLRRPRRTAFSAPSRCFPWWWTSVLSPPLTCSTTPRTPRRSDPAARPPLEDGTAMRVLFISAQRNLNIIGLRYIHECALEAGHDARFLFLNRYDPEKAPAMEALRAFIAEFDPGIVGLSLTTFDFNTVASATSKVREWFPGLPVIWGGIHPTTEPEVGLEHADYVCRGEGEEMMVELLDALEQGRPVDDIANLGYKRDGAVRLNPLRPLVTDLDRFPMLGVLPRNAHIQHAVDVEPLTLAHYRRFSLFRGSIFRILVSRGCPMHCHYCANSFLMGLYPDWRLRWRSTENVMRELEQALAAHPGIKFVTFADDCIFSMKLEALRDFCHQYKTRVGRPFAAKATPAHISRERMDLMVDAGLAWANVGLQDGNDRICREVFGRPIPVARFERAAQMLSEYPVARITT